MRQRRTALLIASLVVLAACAESTASGTQQPIAAPDGAAAQPGEDSPDTSATDTSTDTSAGTSAGTSAATSTDADTTTSAAESTSTSSTTTTVPELDVFDAACVVQVEPGESLSLIADSRDDELVTVATIRAENGLPDDTIQPDQLLDVCIDNGLDDITGEQRLERNRAIVDEETAEAVVVQQAKLNELFVPFGFPEMPVDGISGPVTRRSLCAARLALGLPVSRADMEPGSPEMEALMAAPALPTPPNMATDGRWIFIDLTCQVLITGEGPNLVNVFPTSTGEEEHETRLQERTRAFRFDPALQNDGWHNSTDFPVENDNPLNGNMYKPLYFDGGQAIHGANNVPTSPQSKGCARLRPEHQDQLIFWLGLAFDDGPTNSRDRINATVTVRGDYSLG